jgi:L,D-peptidoglycan transpeptidase YkuD (ErfK/YbiS/YcfS/YnhG family)
MTGLRHTEPVARGQDRRRGRTLVVAAVVILIAACTSGLPYTQPTQRQTQPMPQAVAEPLPPTPTATISSSTRVPTSTKPHPKTSPRRPMSHATARPSGSLPLGFSIRSAKQVITVVAAWAGSTTAVLQAWTAVGTGRWVRHGSAILAHVGVQGLSTSPSESRSATPIGSFTLTTAFGYYGDPGTRLPYLRTTPADWWISQSGPLYNTHQRCSSSCNFVQGWPNEHLYYETPAYDYAVVIDYNTANTGKVTQGAGSAFFLHVTDGSATTAGCVAIPQASLVSIMQWLNPADHPRILIGIG